MELKKELHYTKTHEWVRRQGKMATVGISDYAQKEISDVVFVELPKINQTVESGKPAAVVESVKAAFDIYAPVSGKVVKINGGLESDPAMVNEDPYGRGWFFEIEMTDDSQWDALMTADDYEKTIKASAP